MSPAFWARFDPRAKAGFAVLAMIAVLAAPGIRAAALLALAVLLAVPVLGARGSVKVLRSAALLWGLTVLANAVFHPGPRLGPDALGPFRPSAAGLQLGAFQGLRLAAVAALGAWTAATVSAFDLVTSLEWGARNSDRWRRRVHRVALPILLALRMVPLLAGEAGRLGAVERLRFGPLPWRRRIARLASLAPVWVITTLDRAEDLSVALRLRGYRTDRLRTFARAYRPGPRDAVLVSGGIALVAGAVF